MSILYKIKPLVFSDGGDVGMDFEAETINGTIMVFADAKAGRNTPVSYWNVAHDTRGGSRVVGKEIATLEEANAIAENTHAELLKEWIAEAESEDANE